jgi:hypothetical protein
MLRVRRIFICVWQVERAWLDKKGERAWLDESGQAHLSGELGQVLLGGSEAC